MWLLYVGDISNAPTSNCPPAPSSAISHYHTYLKYVYGNSPISPNTKWPPSPSRKFISLAVVEGWSCRDEYIGHTLQGNVKQVLHSRRDISIEQILEPIKGQKKLRLVLIEGAPGIGKSILAWELCRKWEELSCMKQYSLVVLLRLREEKVQRISEVSHLFISYESKHKMSLVDEVSESQGSGVLFILDGFDELPKILQKESFLLDLIKGSVLPASTVLVTSRPSATAELPSHPQKRIEVIGFTQESVQEYASSIFSSEPEKLKKFMDYISASKNPAINSLMYVPLNAAIIVEIFRDCKSDSLLPHTLTELYTQLCLTILNRDIMARNPYSNRVKMIGDLSGDLHVQFLELSKIAFEGITNEEVVFRDVPDGFIHFGFFDAVSALYGGGRVSYNFLHLTLQEFFAAHHISHLGSSGLEVFQQHGKDKRWNVVWRFVAGLTKFEHYKSHLDSDLFIKSRGENETEIFFFTILCLFEAQSVDHFAPIFSTLIISVKALSCTALDTYALGFCISKFHMHVNWNVDINCHLTPFINGLNKVTLSGCANFLNLCICTFPEDYAEFKKHLVRHVTSVQLSLKCTSDNIIHFSELIPHMTSLNELTMNDLDVNVEGHHDLLLKTLRQLSHSSVTSLSITYTHYRTLSFFDKAPDDYYPALEQLVCPSSGKLKSLDIDNTFPMDNRLASLISGPSSLHSLRLRNDDIFDTHVPHLKSNTCLSRLTLDYYSSWSSNIPRLICEVLKHNKTLKYFTFGLDTNNCGIDHTTCRIYDSSDIDTDSDNSDFTTDTRYASDTATPHIRHIRTIVRGLRGNNTLENITIRIDGYRGLESDDMFLNFMKTHFKELTHDPRVKYCNYNYHFSIE